jgi:hypothetical protein
MPRKTEATSVTIYHVQGHNNRWVTNSQDHSVNVVTQSHDQIFASLRQEIESRIPPGEEQKDILEKLTALAEAQQSIVHTSLHGVYRRCSEPRSAPYPIHPGADGNATQGALIRMTRRPSPEKQEQQQQ